MTDPRNDQAVWPSDAECKAVYDAVTRANLTRDVKSPERKRKVVRSALYPRPADARVPEDKMLAAIRVLCEVTDDDAGNIVDDARMDHLCDVVQRIVTLATPPAAKPEPVACWQHRPGSPCHAPDSCRENGCAAVEREMFAAAKPEQGDANSTFTLLRECHAAIILLGWKGDDYQLGHNARMLAKRLERGDFAAAMAWVKAAKPKPAGEALKKLAEIEKSEAFNDMMDFVAESPAFTGDAFRKDFGKPAGEAVDAEALATEIGQIEEGDPSVGIGDIWWFDADQLRRFARRLSGQEG